MDLETFFETYQPIANPAGTFLDFDEQTYAWTTATIQHAPEHTPDQVWSIYVCDESDEWTIEPGAGVVNVMGYIITQKPWVSGSSEDLSVTF